VWLACGGGLDNSTTADAAPPPTGPATEQRFPPLHVPPGFAATLFACDPLIEYPSVIAPGPRPGTLFVANDYVKGLGDPIVRRDDVRLIEDTDGDGYADQAVVYADGFGSIQGLEFLDGTLYVMHAPLLTAVRDADGDGAAEERRDLLSGLGLPPEQNPSRLHCANGIVAGHDGWLYLALGDNGCRVPRPEGDQIVLEGGGILRCRHDGSDLHVFARGLRNIYDVALDEHLNVFVRDNENDGGDYMVRVCWSFYGADHGYPWLYRDHPDEALRPIADLGRGSSAGGVCYRETQFPPEFRGNLLFCEWGRAVVRYEPQPAAAGAGFADVGEQDFAAGDAEDPYGFKPTDLVVMQDGSLMISDWADGQTTGRGRARIYHVRYVGQRPGGDEAAAAPHSSDAQITALDAPGYHARFAAQRRIEAAGDAGLVRLREALDRDVLKARGRDHAVWALSHLAGPQALDELFALLEGDPAAAVRVQAVRAIADLTDPILVQHRLDAVDGDPEWATRLAAAWADQPASVRLELMIALGRLRWRGLPEWLAENLAEPDVFLAHAAMQSLRQSRNWPAVAALLDRPMQDGVRTVALRALAEQYETSAVDGLIERLAGEPDAHRRRESLDLLIRVRKRPGPWTYWGYRPAPRPANTVAWERTESIQTAVGQALARLAGADRPQVLARMHREEMPVPVTVLRGWLREPQPPEALSATLAALAEHPLAEVGRDLSAVISSDRIPVASRIEAVSLLAAGDGNQAASPLAELARSVEDGPVLVAVLAELGTGPAPELVPLLVEKLRSSVPAVRGASVAALVRLKAADTGEPIAELLADSDEQVRLAATVAAGELEIHSAADELLLLARGEMPALRSAAFRSLRLLKDSRALDAALAALGGGSGPSALDYVVTVGGPEHAEAVGRLARLNPARDIVIPAVHALARWSLVEGLAPDRRRELQQSIAEIQGTHGLALDWTVAGPMTSDEAVALTDRLTSATEPREAHGERVLADGASPLALPGQARETASIWVATTLLRFDAPVTVQCQVTTRSAVAVYWNGARVHEQAAAAVAPAEGSFDVQMPAGLNRLVITVSADGDASPRFGFELRRRASTAEHERLTRLALKQTGDVENGRRLFFDAARTQCIKCHWLEDRGERIGPDLTGIGGRFSRIHLIESILQPSHSIADSYQTVSLALVDGRVLSGVLLTTGDKELVLADSKGEKHVVRAEEIEARNVQTTSTMPEGLEKPLTPAEFVDLIGFLVSRRTAPASQSTVAGP
jgi:putative membrane-bound dehydrogenase-like protein